jgi:Skp family chaperone for outer membrane proteins
MTTTIIVGALGLVLLATTAVAATPPRAPVAAAPAAAISHGPPIPGVCMLSFNQAIGQSTVGGWVRTRLDQLVTSVRAELGPEEQAIQTDDKALAASRATLDQATLQTRAKTLQERYTAFQQKAELRQREMKATQDKALNRIAQELDPIAQQLYQAHRCSLLFDKGSVLFGNPEMDLTASAVQALNGKIQQFPFDREHIDPNTQPAQ